MPLGLVTGGAGGFSGSSAATSTSEQANKVFNEGSGISFGDTGKSSQNLLIIGGIVAVVAVGAIIVLKRK